VLRRPKAPKFSAREQSSFCAAIRLARARRDSRKHRTKCVCRSRIAFCYDEISLTSLTKLHRSRPRGIRGPFVLATVSPCAVFYVRPAQAWVFVEHTSIGRAAMEELACASFRECIDLPMLAALSGDHSCSATDLVATLRGTWVVPLIEAFWANYSDIRKTDLDSIARLSLWHEENLEAQRLDDDYLSRASGSGAHFVLPRTASGGVGEDGQAYARRASLLGVNTNAVGNYVSYHARAAIGDAGGVRARARVRGPRRGARRAAVRGAGAALSRGRVRERPRGGSAPSGYLSGL